MTWTTFFKRRPAPVVGVVAEPTPAPRMSDECEGTLTGSGSARFAPRALQASIARATAAAFPAITSWPGEL